MSPPATAESAASSSVKSLLVRAVLLIFSLQLSIALVTRIALVFQGRHDVSWDLSLLGAFGAGLWYDLLASCYAAVFIALIGVLLPARVWHSAAGRWVLGVLFSLYAVVFVFISVAEWFFWDEFSVRFNFIAVDYLVYTQEVLDNIKQSYPMPAIFTGLAVVAVGIALTAWKLRLLDWVCQGTISWKSRVATVLSFALLIPGISTVFNQGQLPKFSNEFNREIAKNGIYAFCAAFWESEIDYERFYRKRDPQEVLASARKLLQTPDEPPASNDPADLRRLVRHEGPELKQNVVLISVESLSAGFMQHFKLNFRMKSWLTPNLDRIADEGIFFSNFRATGTRTVRGLEALTLSIPPTPGQSIVWRPRNENLFSLGSVFRSKGYDTAYVYGGDAMFDNMRYFFSNNGYRVVDRQVKDKSEITFQNAWGVADEDLFNWAFKEADADHEQKKPFFLHVMTVSNHRPFTFPEGRIDMPQRTRDAAVKYTDYAIGKFLEEAKTKPWFANTIFVVVADHCHGSAGKVELDVTKYQIPCIIWNPSFIKPKVIDRLVSQIDLGPTILGMLNWNYTTRFFGHDVFSPSYAQSGERAYVSNYQKIGLLGKDTLVVLKPKQQFSLGKVNLATGAVESRTEAEMKPQLEDAVTLYQSASWLFRNGRLGADTSKP